MGSDVSSKREPLATPCTCGHPNNWHVRADATDTHCGVCKCPEFDKLREPCDHSTCGWKPRYYDAQGNCLHPDRQCTGARYSAVDGELFYTCPDCKERFSVEKVTHPVPFIWHSDGSRCEDETCERYHAREQPLVLKDGVSLIDALDRDAEERGLDEEPPLTPEEEEELALKEKEMEAMASAIYPEAEPPPPQPEHRPPYAVAYSVNGHLYEVALPGDATVQAVDGALIIQHSLGPVAGIVQVLPVKSKEAG